MLVFCRCPGWRVSRPGEAALGWRSGPRLPTALGDLVGCSLTLQVCPGGTLSGWRRGRAGKSSGAGAQGACVPAFPPKTPEARLSRRSLGPPVPGPDSRLTPGRGRASSSLLQAHSVQRHAAGLPSCALFREVPWDRWVLLLGAEDGTWGGGGGPLGGFFPLLPWLRSPACVRTASPPHQALGSGGWLSPTLVLDPSTEAALGPDPGTSCGLACVSRLPSHLSPWLSPDCRAVRPEVSQLGDTWISRGWAL